MSKYCDNCEFKKKVKFSTLFECKRYGKILDGNPTEKLEECDTIEPDPSELKIPKEELTDKGKKSKKKDFIEVK